MNHTEIKLRAKEILHKNFWKILKPYLIFIIISYVITTIINPSSNVESTLANFLESVILYPLFIGLKVYNLKVIRKGEFDDVKVFMSYKNFITITGLLILINLFTFLWSILLVIPGLIALISYAMAPYLMADGKDDPLACINASKKMMFGYKADYFMFLLSFLGWFLITVVAFWYTIPYFLISETIYYEELKKLTKID